MDDIKRPDPDELLAQIQDRQEKTGRLKIFLGMCAGVGKTYTMLSEARLMRERGEDVAIGWVESHGRAETDALVQGIERIPPKVVDYRGLRLEDMDVEALISRKPATAIVDELAHSNAPGLTHPKRYQDVFDLLESGIDVFTTINIQHIESIADVVEELTGARIRERVPDSVFDRADEIQLVDLPPDELLERLAEGKVYTGDKARDAIEHFFTSENLAMLREITLKHASQIASHRLSSILRNEAPALSTSDNQHILVAIGASPSSEHIIRWTRRFTYALKARWTAIHVETGSELSQEDKETLMRNITLAGNLGATIVTVPGRDPVRTIIEYAENNGVAAIVAGKSGSGEKRTPFFRRRTLSERLARESGTISVIAVQEKPTREPVAAKVRKRMAHSAPWQYGVVLLSAIVVTLVNLFVTRYAGYWSASILYLAAIVLLSMVLDRFPIFVAACLYALAWDFLFIPPRYTFTIGRLEDVLMFLLYFLVALSSGWMTTRLKTHERMLMARTKRMALLHELASILESADSPENAALVGADYIARAFGEQAIVFLRNEEGAGLEEEPVNAGRFVKNEKETSAAYYCFKSGEASGRFTNTLPGSEYHYVPMAAPGGTIGVIGLRMGARRDWSQDLDTFLITLSNTISLAVQREILYERNKKNLLLQESERLSRLLLHSVSHELRTPLTVIQGSASALLDPATSSDEKSRTVLIEDILSGTERLNRIVESLLAMNRLESGKLKLNVTEVDPEELVNLAIRETEKDLAERRVTISKTEELPLIRCDLLLVIRVISNLLLNAAAYSEKGAAIEIALRQNEAALSFTVRDNGPGVSESEINHLFEKFFRGKNAASRGTGLGLSICKGIAEMHGGHIEARNESDGKFAVSFSLPIDGPGGKAS
jgi:two-component system, OmpR family, sensor histidine kinase KdpD